jgi:hypothetical protein
MTVPTWLDGSGRLHAPAELLVEPLDHVCAAKRLPLRPGEPEEGEQLLAPLLQAAHHARAPLGPLALVGGTGKFDSITGGGTYKGGVTAAGPAYEFGGQYTLKQ